MKKKKFSIGRLFYNDKFVMIFSVLVSIILWFTVSATNTSTESHKVISDIPVTIELSQNAKDNDLMVFNDNQTASVSVSGSSFIVSQVQKENILVTALQAGTIDRAGTYTSFLRYQILCPRWQGIFVFAKKCFTNKGCYDMLTLKKQDVGEWRIARWRLTIRRSTRSFIFHPGSRVL